MGDSPEYPMFVRAEEVEIKSERLFADFNHVEEARMLRKRFTELVVIE